MPSKDLIRFEPCGPQSSPVFKGNLKSPVEFLKLLVAVCLMVGLSATPTLAAWHNPAISNQPSAFVKRCLGDQDTSSSEAKKQSEFAAKIRAGKSLFMSGQYGAAVLEFTSAITLQPEDAFAYYHRGIAHQRLLAYAQALSDFTVAIEKGPPLDAAYLNRGAVRAKLGLMVEAESDFNAALKLDATKPDTYFNRALVFLKTNRNQQAIDDITKGIELNSSDAKAYVLRANALSLVNRADDAKRDLMHALKLDPSLQQAQALLDRLNKVD